MSLDISGEQVDGRFRRQDSAFRARIGGDVFPAAADRYHLYVSLACPWAHRAIVVRALKGLEAAVGMTVVDPIRDEKGWRFGDEFPDPVNGWDYLSQAYPDDFEGRVTVPTLWDTETGQIVNNESADVIVDLATQMDEFATRPDLDLYPVALRDEIDALNAWVYATVNNGVYASGFATTQEAYEESVVPLFHSLDRLEARLREHATPFLFGEQITLADIRLFTTLVRFDVVYHGHFKCNLRRIADYPQLQGVLERVRGHDAIGATVDYDHIKRHYYVTQRSIKPERHRPRRSARRSLRPICD